MTLGELKEVISNIEGECGKDNAEDMSLFIICNETYYANIEGVSKRINDNNINKISEFSIELSE